MNDSGDRLVFHVKKLMSFLRLICNTLDFDFLVHGTGWFIHLFRHFFHFSRCTRRATLMKWPPGWETR